MYIWLWMRRNYGKISLSVALSILFLVAFTPLYQYPGKAVEMAKRWHEYHVMNEIPQDSKEIGMLKDEEDAWYTRYMFICHGGVDLMALRIPIR